MLVLCTGRNQQSSLVFLKLFKQSMPKYWHHSKILQAQTILLYNIYSILPKAFLKLPLAQHLNPLVNLFLPAPPKEVILTTGGCQEISDFTSMKPR